MTKKRRILVVDNDTSIVWVLEHALTDEGYAVDTASNGREALDRIAERDYSVAIMDIMMPVMDGLTALQEIITLERPPEVVMITAHSTMENTVEAMKVGAFDFIVKPFDIDEISGLVEKAMNRYDSRGAATVPSDNDHGSRIIGDSPVMRDLYKIVGRVASTDSSVLITGETGTGKDLFARAIHFHSGRRDKSFITVNCASIPADLLESELFGHVKGAFTGATDRRVGKCELADGGTLFLDEIGTMRPDLQAKILRFLQLSEFDPVGASETKSVDVRVIAATNADLKQMTARGDFREDLLYRLMVVPIHIPPLRERMDDITALARYFVARYNSRYGLSFDLGQEQLDEILTLDWPGNVRELENYIHRRVVLQSESITMDDIPTASIPSGGLSDSIDAVVSELIDSGLPDMLEVARERIEKPLIAKTIARFGGNQSEAARHLGVSRNTIRKMLDKYGLHTPAT
jgi:two-component system, NtrC family, nitrogen regulation response regulator GlnG